MACIDGMETEKEFLKAMNDVAKWKITGQHLELSNATGTVVASTGTVVASFDKRHDMK